MVSNEELSIEGRGVMLLIDMLANEWVERIRAEYLEDAGFVLDTHANAPAVDARGWYL
jgi:hypothetical protein